MTISMYDLTIPPLQRGFTVLAHYLDKAEAHAGAHGQSPDALLQARLAPDMLPFAAQVQRASDTAKGAVGRLAGLAPPSYADDEATFAELRERIAKTVAWIAEVSPEQLVGSAGREVALKFGLASGTYRGDQYITTIALPNFYFHVAIAHGILRQQGVAIGKMDYLGYGE